MAVVSAKNDYANQIILKKCRDVNPKGRRTLGIITKPDFLQADSENEASWIELAENKDIFFELGWHLLKNRSDKEICKRFNERNTAEAASFAKGRYRDLPPELIGITSLRGRLSQLLFKHLKSELPALQKELNDKHPEVCRELEWLGDKRSTPQEQRRFLMSMSIAYQDIVNSAVKGHHDDDFFDSVEPDESTDHDSNICRLRAVVQYLNLQFMNLVLEYGQMSRIYDEDTGLPPGLSEEAPRDEGPSPTSLRLDEGYAQFASCQEPTSRDAAIQRASDVLLPCTFNPLLISQLFWEQSQNWKTMAEYHIDKVADICSQFVRMARGLTVSADVSSRLVALRVETALLSRLAKAKAEPETIIGDTKRHTITYDPRYVETVQKRRNEIYAAPMQQLTQDAKIDVANAYNKNAVETYLDPAVLNRTINEHRDIDIEKMSAEEALDDSLAYYEDEVKYFTAVVTKQIMERYLLTSLAAETISPMVIADMTEAEIAFVAAEPEETARERNFLETRKATLEKGQEVFKSTLGGMFR